LYSGENLSFFFILWLYSLCGPWPLFQFLNLYTVGRTPWMRDHPVARPLPAYTVQYKHRINAGRHPCLEWDTNPRSQRSSGRRRFMPYIVRPLCSALYLLLWGNTTDVRKYSRTYSGILSPRRTKWENWGCNIMRRYWFLQVTDIAVKTDWTYH
jgi:hypothetical protein